MARAAAQRLGLGTVAFGLPYGVANAAGQVSESEAAAILGDALAGGMSLLDTAAGYGTAEAVLGRLLPPDADCRIVTKTPPLRSAGTADAEAVVRDGLAASLRDLGRTQVDGLLVHHADDLTGPQGKGVLAALIEARESGLARRIGVSAYTGEQLDAVLDRLIPDVVQIPLSIADQRLLRSGHLDRLKALGVEIHARSLFLQGLLLMDKADVPPFFAPIGARLEAIRQAGAALMPEAPGLAACLAFGLAQPQVDVFVIGVTRRDELAAILRVAQAVGGAVPAGGSWDELAIDGDDWLLPYRWPSRG